MEMIRNNRIVFICHWYLLMHTFYCWTFYRASTLYISTYIKHMKTYVSWRLHILCIMFKIIYRSIVTLAELNIWYTGYYSPIVKPTKISTIAPFNTSNLRTLSSRLSSLCFLSSRWNLLTSRFIRLSLWPFPSQILSSDLSGLIVLPNTTRYFAPYSEHTTVLYSNAVLLRVGSECLYAGI